MRLSEYNDKTHYLKGYKIRIYPTESQAALIDKRINLGITIYNWTIEQEKEQYELYKTGKSDKKFLTYFDMLNKFTDYRKQNPWVTEMPYGSGCKSIKRAVNAFEMFFRYGNRFPRFKSKKHLMKKSYGVRSDTMYFQGNMLRIEGFPRGEFIYTKWDSGFGERHYSDKNIQYFYSPVISKDNLDRYYISFCIITPKEDINIDFKISNPIGIDLNVKDRFVCSNGYRSGSPDLTKLKKHLSKAERAVQRDIERYKKETRTKSSNDPIVRSKRAIKRLNKRRKIADKISNIVENFIQNETLKIINMKPTTIVMEGLSVMDMDKNRKVAKVIHHSNFNRCIEVMKNKCNKFNIPFIQADPMYPSSQLCSNCGARRKISSCKVYSCPVCGNVIDRDLNAALNLVKLAQNTTCNN